MNNSDEPDPGKCAHVSIFSGAKGVAASEPKVKRATHHGMSELKWDGGIMEQLWGLNNMQYSARVSQSMKIHGWREFYLFHLLL